MDVKIAAVSATVNVSHVKEAFSKESNVLHVLLRAQAVNIVLKHEEWGEILGLLFMNQPQGFTYC